MSTEAIGKVTATESKPTTCSSVRFWIQRDALVRPFDIVKAEHLQSSHSYAIVQDLQYVTDSAGHLANYVSSDFGDILARPLNERLGTTIAEAEILYNTREIEMPLRDGAIVEWADADGIRAALGLDRIKKPIPAGWIETSNGAQVRIDFDSRYLLGPEGAHLNIAGISGLATKTSYAIFLLNSVQQRAGNDAAIIIFNVKGSDLLAIDQPDPQLDEAIRADWQRCGLDPAPFSNVVYLYPYAKRPRDHYTLSHNQMDVLDAQYSSGKAWNYYYDVDSCKRKLPLLFSDIDDPQSTMESIFHVLPELEADSWDSFRDQIREKTKAGQKHGDVAVQSWRKFNRLLSTRTQHDLFTNFSLTDPARCQKSIHDALCQYLKPGQVIVVDIEPLPDYLQCLVFGDVIQTIYGAKLGDVEDIDPKSLGKVVVFADELNKYAPKGSEGGRTLTGNLLEVTERGRSLGVILFGAEQFRSGVHDRVLGNCSTNVYGRTSAVELAKSGDYRYFPDSYKSSIARLPQGHLLLQHPVFKTALIRVRFPRPCYYQPKGE
jgi:hypothetical protein